MFFVSQASCWGPFCHRRLVKDGSIMETGKASTPSARVTIRSLGEWVRWSSRMELAGCPAEVPRPTPGACSTPLPRPHHLLENNGADTLRIGGIGPLMLGWLGVIQPEGVQLPGAKSISDFNSAILHPHSHFLLYEVVDTTRLCFPDSRYISLQTYCVGCLMIVRDISTLRANHGRAAAPFPTGLRSQPAIKERTPCQPHRLGWRSRGPLTPVPCLLF